MFSTTLKQKRRKLIANEMHKNRALVTCIRMGFTHTQSIHALVVTHYNIAEAIDLLLSTPIALAPCAPPLYMATIAHDA